MSSAREATPPNPPSAAESGGFPFDSCLFPERVGFVCVAIPKAGCTAAKLWYAHMAFPGTSVSKEDAHAFAHEHLSLSRRGAEERACVHRQRLLVAFVRDPVARLRSAFIEKIVRPDPRDMFAPARQMLEDWIRAGRAGHRATGESPTGDDYERGISFREFVGHVCRTPDARLDHHWRSQASFLEPRAPDVLLPSESLGAVLDGFAARTGLGAYQCERSNVTRKEPSRRVGLADMPSEEMHRANLRPSLEELADAHIHGLVNEHLGRDVKLFSQAGDTVVSDAIEAMVRASFRDASGDAAPTM